MKRRESLQRRGLTPHEIVLFGCGPLEGLSDEQMRRLYVANREQILSAPRNVGTAPWCYWRYDAEVPEQLRALPEYPDPRWCLTDNPERPYELDDYEAMRSRRDAFLLQRSLGL